MFDWDELLIQLFFARDDVQGFFYLLFIKSNNGLIHLWKLKKIKQEKKDSWLGNSSKLKYCHLLGKLVLLK